jgi:hypothetical protein
MALSLACSCGARFEVEDTLAGQLVSCPECPESVRAPWPDQSKPRTSGYALASVIVALVGAFTLVGTVAAVILGSIGLVSIARHRDRVAGVGYAVFGIVAGVALTVFSLFLYSSFELFDVNGALRSGALSSQIDYEGGQEINRPQKGYAITRPNPKWGVARASLVKQLELECDLLLVNASKDCYVEVEVVEMGGRSMDEYLDEVIQSYQDPPFDVAGANQRNEHTRSAFKLKGRRILPPAQGMRSGELLIDVKIDGQEMSFLDRIVSEEGGGRAFRVRAWASRHRFPRLEAELRRAVDSFRILPE